MQGNLGKFTLKRHRRVRGARFVGKTGVVDDDITIFHNHLGVEIPQAVAFAIWKV